MYEWYIYVGLWTKINRAAIQIVAIKETKLDATSHAQEDGIDGRARK